MFRKNKVIGLLVVFRNGTFTSEFQSKDPIVSIAVQDKLSNGKVPKPEEDDGHGSVDHPTSYVFQKTLQHNNYSHI